MSEEEKVHICNQMARRIGIAAKQNTEELFVLPPFGERTIKCEDMNRLDYEPWKQLNLIKIERERKEASLPLEALATAFGKLFTNIVIIAISLSVVGLLAGKLLGKLGYSLPPYFSIYIWAIIIIIVLRVLLSVGRSLITKKLVPKEYREPKLISKITEFDKELILSPVVDVKDKLIKALEVIKEWCAQLFNLLLILTIGVGFPALVIYLFGGVRELMTPQPSFTLPLLGRILQLIFIAIASLLPALMYFLFTHYKLRTLKENFFRDIVQLDPRVITLNDAKSLYENKVNALYGSEKFSKMRFIYDVRSPIFIATILITVGWIFTLAPFEKVSGDINFFSQFFTPPYTPLVFGFLGAYFFGLNVMYRRYVSADLRPKAYTYITVRILVVIILVWVLSAIKWINSDPALSVSLAFMVGIFPEMALGLIQDYLQTFKWFFSRKIFQLQDENSLRNLEGINLFHRTRLLEESIENIENLAHHDIIDLTLQTRIPVPRLVDWIDQAILHLHLQDTAKQKVTTKNQEGRRMWGLFQHGENIVNSESLKTLREFGIRTATDLEQAYEAAKKRNQSEVKNLLIKLEGKNPDSDVDAKVKRFQVILDTLKDDEWMAYIRHWRDAKHSANKIFTIDEIRDELRPTAPSIVRFLQSMK